MNEPTKKQIEVLREFLHEAVVPLIEDVLVKKLGQAMSYAKEQIATPKREWVGLTDEEIYECNKFGLRDDVYKAIEAALRSKNI